MSFLIRSVVNPIKSSSLCSYDGDDVYLWSNENIGSYIPKLPGIVGGDVLTVAASGDQAFDAYMAGARHVDTFDVNRNQVAIINKKAEMIRELDYETFVNAIFYGNILPYVFHYTKPVLWWWYVRKSLGRESVFRDNIQRVAGYLRSAQDYNALREKLPEKINFIHADIMGLGTKLTKKYDVILLSNIVNHMFYRAEFGQKGYYARFCEQVVLPLADAALKPNGIICMDYRWFGGRDAKIYEAVRYINSVFAPNRFDIIRVLATRGGVVEGGYPADTDAVLTMRRGVSRQK